VNFSAKEEKLEENEMVMQYQQTKCPFLLEKIISNRGKSTEILAAKYHRNYYLRELIGGVEDFETEVKQVLLKAINTYKPDYGINFSSYFYNNTINFFKNLIIKTNLIKRKHNGVHSLNDLMNEDGDLFIDTIKAKPNKKYLEDSDLLKITQLLKKNMPRIDEEDIMGFLKFHYNGDKPRNKKKYNVIVSRIKQFCADGKIRDMILKNN
jgi:hypothetical protein